MQILADVRLLSRGGNSGVEEYTRGLLNAIFEADRSNSYALFYNGFRKEPLTGQLAIEGKSNIRVLDTRWPNKALDFSSRFLNFPPLDRWLGADLVFSPHFNLLPKTRAPRIITIPDLSFIHHPQFFSRRQNLWHRLQNIQKQAEQSSAVVTVSEFSKSDLVDVFKIPDDKIRVIYPGISEIFKPAKTASVGRPSILYLGTIEPRKNISLLIRAFNALKGRPNFHDWQLVIAGRLGWLYDEVLRLAEASPYRSDIVFKGAVSSGERVELYNSARMFVFPSFFEGFGFPPIEAQSCGCPVIAANRTSLPEVLGASAVYTDPWKVDELVEQMVQLAENRVLRDSLIKRGLANAERFRWQKSALATLKLFNG